LHWETKAHRSLEVHLLVPLATWTCLTIAKKVEWLAKKLTMYFGFEFVMPNFDRKI
jgi:hypothetical protein